jgi:hypothetical protein
MTKEMHIEIKKKIEAMKAIIVEIEQKMGDQPPDDKPPN